MKVKILRISTALAVFALSGCANYLGYVAAEDENDYGYTEVAVSDQQYRVLYNGKRKLRNDRLADFALRRAAELTVDNGYDWFTVLNAGDSADDTVSEVHTDGAVTYEFRKVQGMAGVYRQPPRVATDIFAMSPDDRAPKKRLEGIAIEIKMGRGLAPKNETSFDAREILDVSQST